MRLGLQLHPTNLSEHGNHFDTLLAVAQAGERAGLDAVLMADHFDFTDEQQPETESPVLECFVAWGPSPPAPAASASANWSSACPIAIPRCWPRCAPHWT